MKLFLLVAGLAFSALASATDQQDIYIDEIMHFHNAEGRWAEYVEDSVKQRLDALVYPELYREELDSWLEHELSWSSVEPLFREKLKARYSLDDLYQMAESLREHPSGYPQNSAVKGVGPVLFNLGVEVAREVYPPLLVRFNALKERYESQYDSVAKPK